MAQSSFALSVNVLFAFVSATLVDVKSFVARLVFSGVVEGADEADVGADGGVDFCAAKR